MSRDGRTFRWVEELSSGASVDIAPTAEKSKLFNHCNVRWSEDIFEIHQLVDGVTQHNGAGGNGGKSTLQVVC